MFRDFVSLKRFIYSVYKDKLKNYTLEQFQKNIYTMAQV